MVYYELKNFYQNHRRYVSSRSADQLMGVVSTSLVLAYFFVSLTSYCFCEQQLASSDLELDCDPLYMNGSLVLNPCGLVANSFFNGKFIYHFKNSIYLFDTLISIYRCHRVNVT